MAEEKKGREGERVSAVFECKSVHLVHILLAAAGVTVSLVLINILMQPTQVRLERNKHTDFLINVIFLAYTAPSSTSERFPVVEY